MSHVSEPSIKGSLFAGAVEDVLRLVDSGSMAREELEFKLQSQDLGWLEKKVAPGDWCPMSTYLRLLNLLVEKEADGQRDEYLRKRGARAIQRLFASGLYPQFETMKQGWQQFVGKLMMTLPSSVYSVGKWTFLAELDMGDQVHIEVSDASELSEIVCLTLEGAMGAVASQIAQAPVHVTHRRCENDKILFELCRRN